MRELPGYHSLYEQVEDETGTDSSGEVYVPHTEEQVSDLMTRARNGDPVALRHVFLIKKVGKQSARTHREHEAVDLIKLRFFRLTNHARDRPPTR